MQTKRGGKHDILSVGRATATTRECLWMRPRDPDTDMCAGTATAPASTECMAHQSCVSATDHDGDRSNCGAGKRVFSRRFVYVEAIEEFAASNRRPSRPIRRAR